jgi:hypothetical protein
MADRRLRNRDRRGDTHPARERRACRARCGVLAGDRRCRLRGARGRETLGRSFSLLDLSVLAAYDLKSPFMSQAAFEETLDVAIDSLARERDLRGFEPGKGWVHATAHAADLLKFLARSPRLTREAQGRVVAAVRVRLKGAGQVFVWGEDARLAATLLSVLRRPDVDPGVLRPWLSSLVTAQEQLWSGELDPAVYAGVRAQVNTLTHLAAMLGREPDGTLAAWERDIQATLAKTAI